jgi:hypothetical protein
MEVKDRVLQGRCYGQNFEKLYLYLLLDLLYSFRPLSLDGLSVSTVAILPFVWMLFPI